MENTMKLFVPHVHFGQTVTGKTWDAAAANGVMATLDLFALSRFGWFCLCGWSLMEWGSDGVVFVKEVRPDC
jgi:hypothetical protein